MREPNDELPDDLIEAVELLRAEEPMRPEWRAKVLNLAGRRRSSVPLSWAIAASIICAVTSASATLLVMRPAEVSKAVRASANNAASLPIRFSVAAPTAKQVSIVGDFNAWNPKSLPMRRSSDGKYWEIEVRLPVGRYTYAFMVDGRLQADPGAPQTTDDGFGSSNSVLMVSGT